MAAARQSHTLWPSLAGIGTWGRYLSSTLVLCDAIIRQNQNWRALGHPKGQTY